MNYTQRSLNLIICLAISFFARARISQERNSTLSVR